MWREKVNARFEEQERRCASQLFPPSSLVVTPACQAEFISCQGVTIRVTKMGSALPHGRGSVPPEGASSRSRLCFAGGRFLTVAALFRWGALPHGRGSVSLGALPHGRGSVSLGRSLTVAALFRWRALPHGRGSVSLEGAPSRSRLCFAGGASSRSRLCFAGGRFLTVAARWEILRTEPRP